MQLSDQRLSLRFRGVKVEDGGSSLMKQHSNKQFLHVRVLFLNSLRITDGNFFIFFYGLQQEMMRDCVSSPSFQMTDRAIVHFYYKNPFNFLYQKK